MKTLQHYVLGGLGAAVMVSLVIGAWQSAGPPPRKTTQPPDPWIKVESHLNQLDQDSAAAGDRHLQRISAFFSDKKKKGAKEFADWAFGWTAKYYAVKSKLNGDDGAEFKQWLQQKFAENVFKSEELQAVLASAAQGYLTETQGLENDALCRIRADVAQDELFNGNVPEFQSDEKFQQEYRRISDQLLPKVMDDLGVGLAGQISNLAVGEVAARAGGPRLSRLFGTTGSGFWSTAFRSTFYIGAGIAAMWVFDQLIEWFQTLLGYGPAADLAGKVEQGLDRMESRLINGDPEAMASYQMLLAQADAETSPEVQQQLRDEAQRMEDSGVFGLRREFQNLNELRSKLRRGALQKLVKGQTGN